MTSLEENIIYTIAYYLALEFPLTTFELQQQMLSQKKLFQAVSLREVSQVAQKLSREGKIVNQQGFWTTKKNIQLVEDRILTQKISLIKIKKIIHWMRLFKKIPYLRGVFLTGTLAMKKAQIKSDWDVLLVLKKNRIWLGRFFVTMVLQLTGKRRYGRKIKDRFCLNHFFTEEGLSFQEQNEFSANEIGFAVPLWGKRVFYKMIKKNKKWVNFLKPNLSIDCFEMQAIFKRLTPAGYGQKSLENILETFSLGERLDKVIKKMMIKKIENNPKTYYRQADIRYGNLALVFLPSPRRYKIKQRARQLFQELKK